MPISPMIRTPLNPKEAKTLVMIRAAAVITTPVSARPTRTARALSGVWPHS
jgi:hypothetical protein